MAFADGRFRAMPQASGLHGLTMRTLFVDGANCLWVGTANGLYSVHPNGVTRFSVADGLPDPSIRALTADARGDLWVATDAGLVRRTGGRFHTVDIPSADVRPRITSLLADRDQNMWVGQRGAGLTRIRDGRVTGRLENSSALSLLEDREGSVWVGGAEGGGLTRLRDGNVTTFGVAEGLSGDMIAAVYEDRQRNFGSAL